MKISSAFIDLPTPPFTSSNIRIASDTPKQNAASSQGDGSESAAMAYGAPKPVEKSTPLPQVQHQSTTIAQAAPSAAHPAERRDELNPGLLRGNNSKPTGLVSIAPKPETPPASILQHRFQLHSAASAMQTTPSMSSTAEQPPTAPPRHPQENQTQPTEAVAIAPKPSETPSTSVPQPQTQLQFTKPIGPAASSLILKYKPQGVPPVPRQRKRASNGKRGRKRKRGNDSENEGVVRAGDSSSDEPDITPTATQTKSGRQVNRPSLYAPLPLSPGVSKSNIKTPNASASLAAPAALGRKRRRIYRKGKETYVNCTHCQRGHSPLTNTIVFCDHCNKAWHQLCHDPPIDNEVVTVKEKEWVCRECNPAPKQAVYPTVVRSNPTLQARPLGPPIHPPLPMPQIEVGGERYSKDERRGYLSSQSHATLVELLVSLSDRSPSMPMFPANLESQRSSKFSYQPGLPTVTRHAASADTPSPGSTAQRTTYNTIPKENPPAPAGRHDESSDESEYEEVEDHRLYPRAGNGFRLPLNDIDLDILQEDPACPTFSYSLHGLAKARAEANEVVPVWGTA